MLREREIGAHNVACKPIPSLDGGAHSGCVNTKEGIKEASLRSLGIRVVVLLCVRVTETRAPKDRGRMPQTERTNVICIEEMFGEMVRIS